MIFDLICDSGHQFEGWFKDSNDLETQQETGLLSCPVCNSIHISKKLAAPKVSRKSNSLPPARVDSKPSREIVSDKQSAKAYKELQGMLSKVPDFVEKNFKDVGNNFADEAIKMHKGEKDQNPIRGTATATEMRLPLSMNATRLAKTAPSIKA